MIYLDSSAVLAHLFAEDRALPRAAWRQPLASSRLLEYEVWTRIHARQLGASYVAAARAILNLVNLIEMTPVVLARALEPFPISVRTLDALHLASIQFVRARHDDVQLASFDGRLLRAARALQIPIYSG